MTVPSTSSRTPSSDFSPRSRRIGLAMSAVETSAMRTGWRLAAIRPASHARPGCARPSAPPLRGLARPGRPEWRVVLQEEDRGRVRLEDLNDAAKQLVEQLLQGRIGECGVGDALGPRSRSPIAPACIRAFCPRGHAVATLARSSRIRRSAQHRIAGEEPASLKQGATRASAASDR